MANRSIERLVYRSRVVQPTPMTALEEILPVACVWNARWRITGALGFTGRTYVQFLEGPTASLDSLLERLRSDPRHTDLRVLARAPVAGRLAAGWTMARIDLTLLEAEVTALLDTGDGDGLAALLAGLVRRGETDAG